MKEYIEQNRERFFEELFSLLRIPSVSAKPEHAADMYRCAETLADLLLEAGADDAGVCETAGYPVVFGRKTVVRCRCLIVLLLRRDRGELHFVSGCLSRAAATCQCQQEGTEGKKQNCALHNIVSFATER